MYPTRFLLTLLLCLASHPLLAQTLAPSADAYVQSGAPTQNFGSPAMLLARLADAEGLTRFSYLQFELANLPAAPVASARLRLYGRHEAPSGSGIPVSVLPGTTTLRWNQSELNYNNAYSLTGVSTSSPMPVSTSTVTTAARWYEWDVTSLVNQRRATGHVTFGLRADVPHTYRASFNSSESAANRPQLLISAAAGTPTLFYLSYTGNVIRARADGTGATTIVRGQGVGPDGIAVNVSAGHVYWTNMGQAAANDGNILRANLDGSNVVTVVRSGATFTPKQMKLDAQNGKLYWADREGMRIMRANLDGSQIETLVTTGTTAADRQDASRWCVGISLDVARGKLYWTQKGGNGAEQGPRGRGSIRRANINIPAGQTSANRTDIEVLFRGLPEPIDLDLDLANRWLYWTDRGDQTISRATMDATPVRQVLLRGMGEVIGISLDLASNQMFFTNVAGTVRTAPLSGGTSRVLLTNQGILTGIEHVRVR